jgi:hypothetical protein
VFLGVLEDTTKMTAHSGATGLPDLAGDPLMRILVSCNWAFVCVGFSMPASSLTQASKFHVFMFSFSFSLSLQQMQMQVQVQVHITPHSHNHDQCRLPLSFYLSSPINFQMNLN